jgi:hypothetical protein
MKRSLVLVTAVALLCSPALAGERTLSRDFSATDLARVVIEAGVGDVTVTAVGSGSVSVQVTLQARRGGLFASKKKAQRQIETAVLRGEVVGRELHLDIDVDADERRFEERWQVEMPAHLATELELGVGDVEIRGTAGGVEIDSGVGDVEAEVSGGDLLVDLGVGNASITAPAAEYGRVSSSSGVGDGRLSVRGQQVEGDGFVGHSAIWTGDGPARIDVEVGVGDARVVLE